MSKKLYELNEIKPLHVTPTDVLNARFACANVEYYNVPGLNKMTDDALRNLTERNRIMREQFRIELLEYKGPGRAPKNYGSIMACLDLEFVIAGAIPDQRRRAKMHT
jgi:hypothetical protein